MQRQRRLLAIAVLAGLGLASGAVPAGAQPAPFSEEPTQYRSSKPYQSEVDREQRRRDAEAGEGPQSPLSFTGGVDFRDQYFFRGYNYVSSGATAQPYAQVGYTVYQGRDVAITPHAGGWLDITENRAPDEPAHFLEFRGDVGVAVEAGKFLLDFQYVYYSSPGNAFADVHEIGVDVRYDDREYWGHDRCPLTGLNPSFSLFYEAKDDRDNDYNTFVGVGLEPTLRPCHPGGVPLTVSFPLTLGGSYDGYYKDDDGHNANFGFWEAGVRCSLPLGRSAYGGHWSVDAEVDFVRLLADSAEAANGHDRDDVVFRLGLSFR